MNPSVIKSSKYVFISTLTNGNTDNIDKIRNTIRTGGNEDAPTTEDGKPNPEGEWPALKQLTTVTVNGESQEGIKRPLSVVSNLLKKKKKILQQERAEINGLRTSNKIKTRQVDGMSLHYIVLGFSRISYWWYRCQKFIKTSYIINYILAVINYLQ